MARSTPNHFIFISLIASTTLFATILAAMTLTNATLTFDSRSSAQTTDDPFGSDYQAELDELDLLISDLETSITQLDQEITEAAPGTTIPEPTNPISPLPSITQPSTSAFYDPDIPADTSLPAIPNNPPGSTSPDTLNPNANLDNPSHRLESTNIGPEILRTGETPTAPPTIPQKNTSSYTYSTQETVYLFNALPYAYPATYTVQPDTNQIIDTDIALHHRLVLLLPHAKN